MATTISHDGINFGFQAGVIHGNVGNVTIVQSQTLNQACLRDLCTTNPLDDKERIKDTKGGLHKDSYRWILENEEFKQWHGSQGNRLLWIRGDPGKGKSMLICGVIEELTRLYGDNANISFFFCQAIDMRINSATSVLRGLIYLLVTKHPSLLSHVQARYDHAGKALFEDVNAWNALSTIFTDILSDRSLQMTYLVIDALDECTDGLSSLLDLIVQESSAHPQIKWIVSSRNWPKITERLDSATQIALVSLELNEAFVSEAVNSFILHKVGQLAKSKRYSDNTRDTVQRYLLSNSQGTFLWVGLVCQNLEKTRIHALKKLELFPPGLDALYGRMLEQVRVSEDPQLCKEILAVISTVYRPITLKELASLIEVPNDEYDNHALLEEIIATCGSFLILREDTIVFVHQSAKDFLLQEALNEILPRGIEAEHHSIFTQSLEVMLKTLRRDIFDIRSPGISAKDIIKPSPNPLAASEYACVYWVDHLQKSKPNETDELCLNDRDLIDIFLQEKYLHWLEALSILGSISDGIQAMQRLEILIKATSESVALLHRAQDASRFIRYHRAGIESSPLQVYYSPLIFSPSKSVTRISFQKERANWVLNNPAVEENWSPCLQTLEGHSGSVESIAWSPAGSRLASGSIDNTVLIWDPATGQTVSTLKGHSGSVNSIAWSPDESRLASGSDDNTVRIWDPASGQSVSTLEGHRSSIYSIAWSPAGSRLASGSIDNTVRIWDPATGQTVSTLKWYLSSISWSPDGSQLALGSYDNTVQIWDTATSRSVSILKGHSGAIYSITWSPDGSRLTSSDDNTVRIWDPATGRSVSILEGHIGLVRLIAWSPGGSRLASGSDDNTVLIWDPATGQSVSTLEGHSGLIYSIAWSPDGSRLASGSDDRTVRIWDPVTGQSVSTLERHSDFIYSIAWSPDGSRLASGSDDRTVRIWDPATSRSMSTLKGHSGLVRLLSWSPDGSQLASGSNDNTVRIWDPAISQSISIFKGHSGSIYSIAWSIDRSRLASGSYDNTVRIWDPATSQSMFILKGHSGSVHSIAWSPDGSRLASGSDDNTVRIWDPATGQTVSILEGHSDLIESIVWSLDGNKLASESFDKTVRIWNPATGRSVSTLPTGLISFLKFDNADSNRSHTSAGTFDKSSRTLLTPESDNFIRPLEQYGYGLSDDRSWITYNGLNLLWLPSEYRPAGVARFAIHTTTIAIACSSNRVIFFALSNE